MNLYIVGTSGSGKSTLSQKLSVDLNLNYIDIDAHRFHENWVPRNETEYRKEVVSKIQSSKPFVADGNYRRVLGRIRHDIDYIIWLDYPFYLVLWRVFSRTIRRLLTKEKICGENYESWSKQFFSKTSIFVWVFKSFRKNRRRYTRLLTKKDYKEKMIHVKHPTDLEDAIAFLYQKNS